MNIVVWIDKAQCEQTLSKRDKNVPKTVQSVTEVVLFSKMTNDLKTLNFCLLIGILVSHFIRKALF